MRAHLAAKLPPTLSRGQGYCTENRDGSSGIKTSDISDIVDKTLEEEGIDDYVQGEQETKVTDPIVQELLKELEKNGIEVSEYDYDPETGDFSYVVLVTQDLRGSGSNRSLPMQGSFRLGSLDGILLM